MKVLVIDNYDSFVHNLARYIQNLCAVTVVARNDSIDLNIIRALKPSHIVLSPGPGHPVDSGICIPIIQQLGDSIPILGICLGHQAIAHAHGGIVERAVEPLHAKQSIIQHQRTGLFDNINTPLAVGRYHSLVVSQNNLPSEFTIDASIGNTIMALHHKHKPIFGLQFHPESVLTECGSILLKNFLDRG